MGIGMGMGIALVAVAGGTLAGALAFLAVRRGRYRREGDAPRLPLNRAWLLIPAGAAVGPALGHGTDGGWELAAALVYLAAGLAVTWTDIDVYRVPTGTGRALLPVLAVPILGAAVATRDPGPLLHAVAGAAIYGAAFVVVALLTPLGMGDVRLAVPSGLLLGAGGVARLWPGALWTVLLAGVIAVALLASRRYSRRDPMPFAPAIVAGTLVALCL